MIGIAGPVFNGTLEFSNNINHWCPIKESDISEATGIENVKLMNDFVANGYGIIGLREEEQFKVYEPVDGVLEDNVRLVFGIGTGLGICKLARPDSKKPFDVYPSEGGVVRMKHYDERDRQFERYYNEELKLDRHDVEF